MELNFPQITIITVCYNAVALLEDTILSVIALKNNNIDYIVVDGASTDGTLKIIEKYNAVFKHILIESDEGIYDAMNKGWQLANPDSYILYLGAGDKIKQLPGAESFIDADIVFGDVEIGANHLYRGENNFMLKLGNTIHHQAELVRKQINPTPPFDLQYKTYADFNFNQLLLLKKARFRKDASFRSFALEGGISYKFDKKEPLTIVKTNFGVVYYLIARLYYFYKNGNL